MDNKTLLLTFIGPFSSFSVTTLYVLVTYNPDRSSVAIGKSLCKTPLSISQLNFHGLGDLGDTLSGGSRKARPFLFRGLFLFICVRGFRLRDMQMPMNPCHSCEDPESTKKTFAPMPFPPPILLLHDVALLRDVDTVQEL